MRSDEARVLLGFHPNSRPTPAQIKAAYKNKVWESHPDLFPINEKSKAESKFKQVSEAYSCLQSGGSGTCFGDTVKKWLVRNNFSDFRSILTRCENWSTEGARIKRKSHSCRDSVFVYYVRNSWTRRIHCFQSIQKAKSRLSFSESISTMN